eukprot:TRINITY_DN14011_c0_g1_i2.p1 TRINITY_DN14011_c0_g1~~TRINITY_DN14011_c0_g1_i2.p1  ORF type:complete len:332 (+),score=84.03 TRINITY_DN14011_c0_g1_i2:42-998(+)
MGRAGRIFTIGMIGSTGVLSVWQANRFLWKQELIRHRMKVCNEPPVSVPPRDMPDDLIKVRMKGFMQNDEFIAVGPRTPIVTAAGEIDKSQAVYTVYVPFLTKDGDLLFVNRGQVPLAPLDDIKAMLYKWPCVADITVMIREQGKRAKYPPRRGDRVFPRPDAPSMWEHYKLENEITEGVTPLVNRGQVPLAPLDDIKAMLYKWPCVADITVMIREQGKRAKYPPRRGDRVFPRPDAPSMWEHYKLENEITEGVTPLPYYADLIEWHFLPQQPELPLMRHSSDYIDHQVMPMTHLSYCATWTGSFLYGLYYLKNARSI